MELRLERRIFNPNKGTIGELYVDDVFMFYTLEDVDRELETIGEAAKIPGKTAIPKGKYKVVIDWSPKYKKDMPHVLDVPYFTGIRFHIGNFPGDTEGCILVGVGYDIDEFMVTNSRTAFSVFFPLLKKALDAGEDCWLEVI